METYGMVDLQALNIDRLNRKVEALEPAINALNRTGEFKLMTKAIQRLAKVKAELVFAVKVEQRSHDKSNRQ